MSRKVLVSEWKRAKGQHHHEKVAVGAGIFLQFGIDYVNEEHGVGIYSTALVEMNDGSVKNVPVDLIIFCDPE